MVLETWCDNEGVWLFGCASDFPNFGRCFVIRGGFVSDTWGLDGRGDYATGFPVKRKQTNSIFHRMRLNEKSRRKDMIYTDEICIISSVKCV